MVDVIRGIESYGYGNQWADRWDESGFLLASLDPGRATGPPAPTTALNWFGTASDSTRATWSFDNQNEWFIGFNLQLALKSGMARDSLIFRLENGPSASDSAKTNRNTVLAVILKASGALAFCSLGSGTDADPGITLGVTSSTMPVNAWTYVEVHVKIGAGANLQCWFDDVQVLNIASMALTGSKDNPQPYVDRISRYLNANAYTNLAGVLMGDIYVADGQVNALGQPQAQLGPCQTNCWFPTADAVPPQWVRTGGASDAAAVTPPGLGLGPYYIDGDGSSFALDWFSFDSPACFGLLYALGFSATREAKISSLSTLILQVRPGGRGSPIILSGPATASTSFLVQTGISEAWPVDNSRAWTAGDVGNAYWGLLATAGQIRCGQAFIETLTSLRNQPYSCGGASNYAV